MENPRQSQFDWEAVAESLPGGLGVQVGETFVHASASMAELVGVETQRLTGQSWRCLFDAAEEDRVEAEALAQARREGHWNGTVRVEGRGGTGRLEVTLSTTENGTVVWKVSEAASAAGGDADATSRAPHPRIVDMPGGFVRTIIDALDDVLYVVDEDGNLTFWNQEMCDRFGYDDEEVAALEPKEFLRPREFDELPVDSANMVDVPDRKNIVDLVTKHGDTIPHELIGVTSRDEETGDRYRVGIARDITERLERERRLMRQRDELATLDRINQLLLETVEELVQTSSRDAVERTICERLAAADRYQFAWVGEQALDGNRIVPRVTAGEDDDYVAAVTITDDDTETGQGPAGRALNTGEVQVVNVDDPSFEPWRAAARERGVESAAAVPLQDGDTVYGVLLVYATVEDAFHPREQAGFEVLGRTVGSVIHAARNRDLLFADAVVELEFDLSESESVLPRTARDLGCELELDGYVTSGGQWLLYLSVTDAAVDAVVDAVIDDSGVVRARTIGDTEGDEGGRVELLLSGASLLSTVSAAGGTVTTATATPDGAEMVIEAPADAAVAGIVDQVQQEFADAEFRARRECDREVTTVGRPGGLLDELTDRQREVMEVAFRAGYFTWPRESTAEEVAESLDLSSPTLHGHLRKAQQSVLGTLFENE